MSIDDDIFDVRDRVQGTNDEKSFERIELHIADLEVEVDELRKVADTIRKLKRIWEKL